MSNRRIKIMPTGKRKRRTIVIVGSIAVFIIPLLAINVMLLHDCKNDGDHFIPFRKSNENIMNDGHWYNFSFRQFRLFAFSAFYDDRPSLLSPPVIRLITVSDKISTIAKNGSIKFYCILHHSVSNVVVPLLEDPKEIGFGWPLFSKTSLVESIYTCPTIGQMIPHSVSINTNPDEHVSFGVPVSLPQKPAEKQDFCVCVQAAYGSVDPYRMIEWLELLKILGVNLVGITIFESSDATLKVLEHYYQEGFVDLRKTSHIFPDDTETKFYWLQLSPIINDCMYRHMYEFHKIIVIDFDEIIIPRKHRKLLELVKYLDQRLAKNNSFKVHFGFRNTYYFLELPPDKSISPYFTMLKYRQRSLVSPEGYWTKSIINPQACTHMHNHYCWYLTANYSRFKGVNTLSFSSTELVEPTLGLNQHYKGCNLKAQKSIYNCTLLMINTTQDDFILQFRDALTDNVRRKVKVLMGHSI